jgi:hypothetical protein
MKVNIASISKTVLLVLILICLFVPLAFPQENENESRAVPANQLPLFDGVPTVRTSIHHDVSAPLRDLAAFAPQPVGIFHEAQPVRRIPLPAGLNLSQLDPVWQTAFVPATPTVSTSFDGLSDTCGCAPPDTEGAVGSTQYVQWINTSFAIFNKTTGAMVAGPTSGNALWKGFGGGCETNNDGDPIVLYDKLANRWVFSQFSVSTTPFLQCVAVSTTSDATGTYNRYSFQYPNFDDYPKMGVWPDAYYETFNMFNGNTFVGSDACAYDRNAMLSGQATAKQVCFQQNSSVGGLLPSDVDGTTPPPAGSPNFMLFFGNNNVNLFKFHVDFTNTSNSTFTGPTVIPVAAFSPLCGGGTCVPQSGTTNQLDSLADRLMYRFAYRNFGDHESLVVNHSVTAGSGGGVRWYEIRNPNGTPVLFQQGTFAPDSSFRWMGSMAMDHAGDIAVGYSVSSSAMHPSIAFTGRVPSDPPGTLETESNIIAGGGSQTGTLNRWGDYSALTVDPVDDCTFWYTDEYLKASGTFNWNTRIANFKFPNCGNTADFTLSASGSPQTVTAGNSATYTATVSPVNGFTGSVSLTVSGLPSGASGSFSPNPVTGGSGSSTLTVTTSPSTPPGTYTLTITGTSGSTSHTTTVMLTVNAPPSFSLMVTPNSQNVVVGGSTSYTATVTPSGGFSGTVTVTISSGLPSGTTSTGCSVTVPPTASCTLPVNTAATTPTGTFTLTVTATGGGQTHTAMVTLNVTPQPVPDFSVSATPASQMVTQGGSTTYTVTVGAVNGFAGIVTLSVNGLPANATGTFNPPTITASGTSTLTVATTSSTPTGTSSLTIMGTSGSVMHSTPVSLTVNPPTGLPPGWTDGDIGAPAIRGSATFSNGTFTVKGGGADIWSTSDHFNYASESIAGNLTITARVASQQNTNAWAKSGVMIRASRAANSAFVHVFVTPGHGVNMQVRRSTGASASQVAQVAGRVAPQWVRIVRSGSTFTGFTSTDGVTFTRVGQVSITMTTNALEGLSVCAHNNAALNTSTFDNVTIH